MKGARSSRGSAAAKSADHSNETFTASIGANKKRGLSPVAALALRVVKGWIRVVQRGRGGEIRAGVPYTRLTATEVQEQLEREQGVIVSTKTVQRALTSLVAGGHLTRRQLYKHRYNRTYWYSWSTPEQEAQAHRPTVVAAANNGSKRSRPPVPDERTRVSSQALKAQIKKSNLAGEQPNSQTALTEERAVRGSCAPLERPLERFWGRRTHKEGSGASGGRLEQAQQKLEAVVRRAVARGFGNGAGSYQAEDPKKAGFLR